MSQTPQKQAHNSADAPPVTGHGAVAAVIYVAV